MKKLLADDWALDLTPYKITETETNASFSDSLFSKISLPFEIDLTDELDVNFGFIRSYNTNPQTLYNVKYIDGDDIFDAVFEIIEESAGKLSCTYEYGIDNFPSWDKKLSELSLHDFYLASGVDIYQHAEGMINKVYPEVDYCWPMIHADFIDKTSAEWENFQGLINNRINGQFVKNSIDNTEIIYYNRNYMQPVPFWMYLLKKGIEEAGYTLKGDILTDDVLLKKAVFSPREYFTRKEPESTIINQIGYDYNYVIDTWSGDQFCYYGRTINVDKRGKYLLQGTVNTHFGDNTYPIDDFIKNISIVFSESEIYYEESFAGEAYNINFYLNVTAPTTLVYGAKTFNAGDMPVIDLELILLYEYDIAGNPIPNIRNLNHVNLKQAVPDVTFGDFVKATRLWRNYTFELKGKEIWMDKVSNILDDPTAEDLSYKQVKYPTRTFQQGMSFLLKFIDVDVKDYTWDKVFHNINGNTTTNYNTDSKTNTIEINALPLPVVDKSLIKTAVAFEKDEAKIYALFYEGLYNSKNVATNSTQMLLPSVHTNCYKKWFDFRIFSMGFKWSFICSELEASAILLTKKIYAYKNHHIIKSFSKTRVGQTTYEVELETESIK